MRLFHVIIMLWALVGMASAEQRKIIVTGSASVQAVPDMAIITMGVSHQRDTARDAVAEVAVTSGAILSALQDVGVAPSDMQTSNLSLTQVWDHRSSGQSPRVTGYEASNQITVRIRDLAVLGDILGHVTAEGANRFQGLRFTLQDPNPQMEEARRRAVADGQARAELYAAAAGVPLGALIGIREDNPNMPRPMPMMREALAADMAMPVAEGELTLSASVTMTYAIGEGE